MGTLVNSEDPDEMPHKAAFHQDLHCFVRLKRSSKNFDLRNSTLFGDNLKV